MEEADKNTSYNNVVRMAKIHDTATIHPEAEIGRNVKIGPYTIIGKDVTIKSNTKIGPHVVIKGSTFIGEDNEIFHGTVIGLSRNGINTESKIYIGNNNTLRENVTIYQGGQRATHFGDNNFIMAYCNFAEGCHLEDNIVVTNACHFGPEVTVEDQAVIAGLSEIEKGVKVGKIAMIGAHSRVEQDVPPYILVDGHPAHVKNINVIGLRRSGFKPVLRKKIKKIFKIFYHSDLEPETALKKIKKEYGNQKKVKYFIDFIENKHKNSL